MMQVLFSSFSSNFNFKVKRKFYKAKLLNVNNAVQYCDFHEEMFDSALCQVIVF